VSFQIQLAANCSWLDVTVGNIVSEVAKHWIAEPVGANIGFHQNHRRILLPAVISLRDVVEALDLQSDELSSYLDPDSGEIVTFNEEQAHIAENGDWSKAPVWMREVLPKIKRALEDEHMLPLPDRAHIDEWRMMQDFADEQDNCQCQVALSDAVQGSGAFLRFRRAIQQCGMEEQWRRYRDMAFERVAREWLEGNQLKYR
jgi:hypothetical protein